MAGEGEIELRFGEGWISGYGSALLGLSSLGGVLCFRYPSLLTTADLRALYEPDVLRVFLFIGIAVSAALGAANFVFANGRRQAVTGLAAAALATLLGGAGVETSGAPAHRLAIGLDWMVLSLLLTGLVFVALEKLWPHCAEQPVLRRQWRTDLEYFALSHLLVSYVVLVTLNAAPLLFGWAVVAPVQSVVSSWPIWIQLPVIVLAADLAQYAVHRFHHRNPFLWRVHAVHHSAPVLDWLAGSRLHLLEILLVRSAVFVPIFLLGFSQAAIAAYVVFVGAQAVLVHANVGWNLDFLRYVLVIPRYHHWHHSDDRAATDTNFAVHLPVIDLVFGTYHLPAGRWPESYGVQGEPLPDDILGQHAYAFRR